MKIADMLKTIAITGPESSGKTTLAQALARHYRTAWAPEYAREYLDRIGRPYEQADILEIGRGQLAAQAAMAAEANRLLICDTDLLVLKVWSNVRYGQTDPWIEAQLQSGLYDLFLLCRPDIPWEYDPLRENPDDRDWLYQIYLRELQQLNLPFAEISGMDPEQRLRQAVDAIEIVFANPDI